MPVEVGTRSSPYLNLFTLRKLGIKAAVKGFAKAHKPGRKAAITGAALLGISALAAAGILTFYFVGHSHGASLAASMGQGGSKFMTEMHKFADWTKSLSKGQIAAAVGTTVGGVALVAGAVKFGPGAWTKAKEGAKALKEKIRILRLERAIAGSFANVTRSFANVTNRLSESKSEDPKKSSVLDKK